MPTWPRAAHAAGHPDQRHPGHAVLARDAAELRDALESNLEVLEDLKTMVNDMLFLARADRGERAADRSAISLAAEARRVAELRRRAGRARHPPALRRRRGRRGQSRSGAPRAGQPDLQRNQGHPAGHEILLRCEPSPAAPRGSAQPRRLHRPHRPAPHLRPLLPRRPGPRSEATAWAWPSSAPSPACTTATWTPSSAGETVIGITLRAPTDKPAATPQAADAPPARQ